MLLQSVNHVVGDETALVLTEPLAETPHQLAGPDKRERDRKPERVAAGASVSTYREPKCRFKEALRTGR